MEEPRPTRRRRAVKSCDRCRRQKLKCDSARPCTLCVHSGTRCETARNTLSATETPKQRRSANQSRYGSSSRREPLASSSIDAWETPNTSNIARNKQSATNSSTVDFARQVFNEAETGRSLTHGVLPGDSGIPRTGSSMWCLKELQLPSEQLMWAAIDAYFLRMHWLLGLVHEASFRTSAKRILRSASWERRDLSNVLLVLTVAAVGIKAALADPTWPGHNILSVLDLDACTLMQAFISEIRIHLLDLMEDSSIEAVQVCMLLSSLHGYHDSPSLAWTLARMAINAAIYLKLDETTPSGENNLLAQVRDRCWNCIVVLDTYISIIYGRPLSTDPALAKVHTIQDSEDMQIDPSVLALPVIRDLCDTSSKSSFYNAQFRLYGLIRRNLSQVMQIRGSNDTEVNRFDAISYCADESETLLNQWYNEIPSSYSLKMWMENDRWELFDQSLRDLPLDSDENGKIIILQAAALQIIYDGALILVHQPILEYRMNASPWSNSMVSSVQKSLRTAVEAATRISKFPVHIFRKQFSISFICFHLFTAGVILCLIPPAQPLSPSAQEAKAGILRIIQTCRAMRDKDRTAKQTEELLIELFKVTGTREMNSALESSGEAEMMPCLFGSEADKQPDRSSQDTSPRQVPNIEESIDPNMEFPTAMPSISLQNPYMSDQFYQRVSANESIDPIILQPALALQQQNETFGSFGKCKLFTLAKMHQNCTKVITAMLYLLFDDQFTHQVLEGSIHDPSPL
ncbi:hypothetical protein N7456_008030 [Penicillium angulare]|uniref:Zn(2)-C6 fungal-type domain-containing protein n=1 Tax=Penicillium angulare TaxID=116970 RepID=A0A9W9FC16_9EURO|nr:hypothetical protein N7456_008030 [Penicillium angulare]